MLVAQRPGGERVEADRELSVDAYVCPLCAGAVILKRGRVKVEVGFTLTTRPTRYHKPQSPDFTVVFAGES